MQTRYRLSLATLAAAAALTLSPTAHAGGANLDCNLRFQLTGWSAVFQHAEGTGTVTCENGRSVAVKINVKGAGLTVGKYHIDNGKGSFSDVHNIDEIFGDYASADAHAGAVKSAAAQVLTKGTVSLAISGSGQGVNIGVGISRFTLSPAGKK